MKTRYIILVVLALISAFVCDILVRVIYCKNVYLSFNSTEFNNIATPLISFFGFIGLIITVKIALNQFKLQLSSDYFKYYREVINNILEKGDNGANILGLLDFLFYSGDKYSELIKHPEYLKDLQCYKNGEIVISEGRPYDAILGNVRLVRTKIGILLKRYELLIVEISSHKNIDNSHKDLLLKELFNNQILKYKFGLDYLEMDSDFKAVKENLYIAFGNYPGMELNFYDNSFYALKNLVEKDIRFKKYLNGND